MKECIPNKELKTLDGKSHQQEKGWTLFKCASCDYLTYARNNSTHALKKSLSTSFFDAAVVTNLPVKSDKIPNTKNV